MFLQYRNQGPDDINNGDWHWKIYRNSNFTCFSISPRTAIKTYLLAENVNLNFEYRICDIMRSTFLEKNHKTGVAVIKWHLSTSCVIKLISKKNYVQLTYSILLWQFQVYRILKKADFYLNRRYSANLWGRILMRGTTESTKVLFIKSKQKMGRAKIRTRLNNHLVLRSTNTLKKN